jgi:hypothetical protein
MNLDKVLSELREELTNLDAAIISLERLQQEGRRRGRPPKVLAEIKSGMKAAQRPGASRPRPAVGGAKNEG